MPSLNWSLGIRRLVLFAGFLCERRYKTLNCRPRSPKEKHTQYHRRNTQHQRRSFKYVVTPPVALIYKRAAFAQMMHRGIQELWKVSALEERSRQQIQRKGAAQDAYKLCLRQENQSIGSSSPHVQSFRFVRPRSYILSICRNPSDCANITANSMKL